MLFSLSARHRAAILTCLTLLIVTPEGLAAQPSAPSLVELVEMREIDSLTISPDGTRLAYRVVETSLGRNRRTIQWFAVPLDRDAAPTALGGTGVPRFLPLYDVIEQGLAQWMPDLGSLLVQWVEPDAVQVHRLYPDGTQRRVTDDPADVHSFRLTEDGTRLDYRTRAPRAQIARAQAAEEAEGIRLDERVITQGLRLTRNFRIGARETTIRRSADPAAAGVEAFAGDWRDHQIGLAAAQPQTVAPDGPRQDFILSNSAYRPELGAHDATATGNVLQFADHEISIRLRQVGSPNRLGGRDFELISIDSDGIIRPCALDICRGEDRSLRQIMLIDATGEVAILRRDALRSSLHAWNPRTGQSRLIYGPDGILDGGSNWSAGKACSPSGYYLICVEEGPTRPPRLIRIDMRDGSLQVLDDPNSSLAARAYGETRFLTWQDSDGNESNGVLMLPRAGPHRDLPLVITSYDCSGFMSGSMSDLAPEPILVEAGIAALCMTGPGTSTFERRDDQGRLIPAGPQRAFMSLAANVIDRLVTEGLVDRSRVGISGHSFSAASITYAISHSDLFAAAVGQGGILDPGTHFIHHMGEFAQSAMGLPSPYDPEWSQIWRDVSPAYNANRVNAAYLIQAPELEWLLALEFFRAISDAGGIVDAYVFPDEGHMAGYQPIHEFYKARRSIDWFNFWLQGREAGAPDRVEQYRRWREIRATRCTQRTAQFRLYLCTSDILP